MMHARLNMLLCKDFLKVYAMVCVRFYVCVCLCVCVFTCVNVRVSVCMPHYA